MSPALPRVGVQKALMEERGANTPNVFVLEFSMTLPNTLSLCFPLAEKWWEGERGVLSSLTMLNASGTLRLLLSAFSFVTQSKAT